MSKVSIKVRDTNFAHIAPQFGSCNGDLDVTPQYMEWYRGEEYRDITVYTDTQLHTPLTDSKIHIAMIFEPPVIHPKAYEYLRNNLSKFNYVLTYNDDIVNMADNVHYFSMCGCWLYEKDIKLYHKSKNLSIIASGKAMTEGHRFRNRLVEKHRGSFDRICGRAYDPIDYKLEALAPYRYSVPMENSVLDTYFTDRLVECFMTGTIPIYYGSRSVTKFFNPDGILFFQSMDEFEEHLSKIGEEDYEKRKSAILENFELSKKYVCVEDYLFTDIIKPIIGD